jgi:hypothetical protein
MISASDAIDKVDGLSEWDLAGVPENTRIAEVTVVATYPELTEELLRRAPIERLQAIAQQLRVRLDTVLATGKLSNWTLLKDSARRGGRYHSVRGEVRVLDIPTVAQLEEVSSIRIENTNGKKRLKQKAAKKKLSYYCVKMTVAIQIEGRIAGMQTFEERYVLFKAYSEAEAAAKAEVKGQEYSKPYLNSAGELVLWRVERIDGVYEVVPNNQQNLDGAEVFSVLKSRRLTTPPTPRTAEQSPIPH